MRRCCPPRCSLTAVHGHQRRDLHRLCGADGGTFLLPVELQVVSGYSPLESGVALLPLTMMMLALSARSGPLAARMGPRLQMSAGPVLVGAGLALSWPRPGEAM